MQCTRLGKFGYPTDEQKSDQRLTLKHLLVATGLHVVEFLLAVFDCSDFLWHEKACCLMGLHRRYHGIYPEQCRNCFVEARKVNRGPRTFRKSSQRGLSVSKYGSCGSVL